MRIIMVGVGCFRCMKSWSDDAKIICFAVHTGTDDDNTPNRR